MKFFKTIPGCLFLVLVIYILYTTFELFKLRAAFDQTKPNDSVQQVIARFGKADMIQWRIDDHYGAYDSGSRSVCGGKCWMRFEYVLPVSLCTTTLIVDFDVDQKVIYLSEHNSD